MEKPKKIILIVVDSLRADHLGCYGYKRNTSPNIDKIAKENILFKWAFSAISYTVPSFTSILTSLYPSSHSIGYHHKFPKFDKDKDILLPEILKSEGYSTAAFIGSMALRKEIGLDAGFDVYDDPDWRNAQDSNEKFFSWLDENHDKNLFAMMHYFDVHIPYKPPSPYNKEFVKDKYYGKAKHLETKLDGWLDKEIEIGGIPKSAIISIDGKIETDTRYYISQYDGCIKYVDNAIAEVIKKLKKLNIYDDCLLIITADHGDAMGENDVWFFHGYTVTPDVIHVPLIMKFPEQYKGDINKNSVVDTHVSHIDLMPTILDMIEYDTQGLSLQGKSLINLVKEGSDESFENRIINAEIQGQIASIDKNTINVKPQKIDKNNIILFHIDKLCEKEIIYNYREEQIKKGFMSKLIDKLSNFRSTLP
ncbi:MAG: sulfatase [Candidatus Methanoperedens sp.]